MMRIGVIYLGRRGSGGPISYEIASRLAQRVDVFAMLSAQSDSLETWRQSRLSILTVPTYTNLPQAFLSWIQPSRFRLLAEQVRSQRPDVLFFPMFYTWNPFLQRNLGDIPSLVAVHDPVPHPGLRSLAFKWLEDASLRQAARCLIFSQSLAGALQQRGVPAERIILIPHGELSYYTRLQPAIPRTSTSTTLLFFGRITAYKGLDGLLQAYRRLIPRPGLRLLLVGEGDLRPYRSQMDGLPGIDIVNRWVADEEVGKYFGQANVVVLPYTSASQSGVIALAAAYGLPVVSTRVGGIPEQVEDGVSGLLVDPDQPEQLENAIKRLLDEPDLGDRLGRNLKRRFAEDFSWDRLADRVYQACQDVTTHSRGLSSSI
jgi:glycosyltransferase involved in cell wall biosynthesis